VNIVNTEAVFITAQPRGIHMTSETSKNCIHSSSSLSTENCPAAVSSWLALLFLTVNLELMKLTTIHKPLAVSETHANIVNTEAVFITAQPRCIHIHSETLLCVTFN
jgi:hypothetical protein